MSRSEVLKNSPSRKNPGPASAGSAAPPAVPATPSREERLVAWVKSNQRLLSIAGAVLIGVVLITWFLAVSSARKQAFALAQLEQAWATQDGGNLPLAASEFQRIATTYRGTDAAYQAVLSLNSTRLQLGQAQLAVDDLRQFVAANPPVRFRIPGLLLVAAGLENLARPAEAAEVYEQAAAGAELDFQKADALVSAARAWQAAGNRDRAMAALRQVVERYPETSSHAEAQVRLGELTVSQP